MCHTTFALHFYDLTLILGGGVDGGVVTGRKAAKPVTAVQDCVTMFVKCENQWIVPNEGPRGVNICRRHTPGYF